MNGSVGPSSFSAIFLSFISETRDNIKNSMPVVPTVAAKHASGNAINKTALTIDKFNRSSSHTI